jgi:branched-chain amino acid transport system ATP-binding protein
LNYFDINIKEAGYGKKVILNDISLSIEKGKITSFIGPNGAGKSTLLKTIIGTIDFAAGTILFNNENLQNLSVEQRVRKGISFVPQGNKVFPELSVFENLEIGGYLIKEKQELKKKIEQTLEYFPQLKSLLKNEAGDLSGGEKQQLALARVLILEPEVIMLDEPSLGLSPQLILQAFEIIQRVREKTDCTILIVEQKVNEVLKLADRVVALKLGRVVNDSSAKEIISNNELLKEIFL